MNNLRRRNISNSLSFPSNIQSEFLNFEFDSRMELECASCLYLGGDFDISKRKEEGRKDRCRCLQKDSASSPLRWWKTLFNRVPSRRSSLRPPGSRLFSFCNYIKSSGTLFKTHLILFKSLKKFSSTVGKVEIFIFFLKLLKLRETLFTRGHETVETRFLLTAPSLGSL